MTTEVVSLLEKKIFKQKRCDTLRIDTFNFKECFNETQLKTFILVKSVKKLQEGQMRNSSLLHHHNMFVRFSK